MSLSARGRIYLGGNMSGCLSRPGVLLVSAGQILGGFFMASDAIVEITDANFDQTVLKSDRPVMIDFWAAWCGPCRALAPIVDEVAKQYGSKVVVGKMDVDKNTATPQRYGVRGIPTLLVFKGGQVREQIVGYVPKETIEKALDKNLS
jgi:thioredoxin 1